MEKKNSAERDGQKGKMEIKAVQRDGKKGNKWGKKKSAESDGMGKWR